MMPDIKGIVPLIYMIFAPRLSYRETTSNDEKIRRSRGGDPFSGETIYTGVLCGMGGQNPRNHTNVTPIYKVNVFLPKNFGLKKVLWLGKVFG